MQITTAKQMERRAQPGFRLGMRNTRRMVEMLVYACLAVYLVVALMPTAWLVSTALQTEDQIRISLPVQWLPKPATLENFRLGWQAQPWLRYLRNTLIFALGSGVGLVFSSCLVGYAFARMRFPGREALMFLNISLMLLPSQVTMIPTFILWSKLGWIGSYKPVIAPFFFAVSPYYVFLMRQFFRSIPMELSDAARIDGCTELGIFWWIVLPLAKPAVAVMVAGHITWAWNDLLTALIYLKDNDHRPLVLALQAFIGVRGQIGWGPLMAMSLLVALPVVGVYFILQRYFTQAFILSGLRG